jgi:hypothetical protein
MITRRKLPTVEETRAARRAAGEPALTPHHHDLIKILAERAVDDYLAEIAEQEKTPKAKPKKGRTQRRKSR